MRHYFHLLGLFLFSFLFACTGTDPGEEIVWKNNDNTLRVRQPISVRTMNPYMIRSSYEADVLANIFQSLMDFDPETYNLKPVLIESTPVISDITEGDFIGGKKYIFQIREAATWSDGQPVTGYDFAFTLKCIFNPKLPTQMYRAFLDFVKNIEVVAVNPKQFSVITDKSYFLALSTISTISVMPEHIYDPTGLLKSIALKDLTDPNKLKEMEADENVQQFAAAFGSDKFSREIISGSGPYQLDDWADEQRLVISKKENWWGNKLTTQNPILAAYPDTIIFIPIKDQIATINAIKSEQLDVAYELDALQFIDLKNTPFLQPIFDFYTPESFTYFATLMNNRNPKLADKKIRQALAHLVNMEEVISTLYNGLGERMIGPFFPDKKYFDASLQPIEFDLEKAKLLLAEAGWADSNENGIVDKIMDNKLEELELEYLYSPTSTYQDNFTELMKNNAEKAGIKIERTALDANVIRQKRRNGNYELAGWGTRGFPQPDDPKQLWHTDGAKPNGANYARFGNEESDALIEAIRNAPDDATRNEFYLKFQRLVYDEQPMIFHLSPKDKVVVHDRFEPAISRMGLALRRFKLKN